MNYYRSQIVLILLALIAVIYTLFFYVQNAKLEKSGILTPFKVIEQGCRNSKGSSSVHISHNGEIYYIRLANKECLKYPKGSKIVLIYNDKFDYFYKPDGLSRDSYRLFFAFAFLLLSVLPWKMFMYRTSLKNR